MPTPKPVSKKLEEVLGEEVGGSMSEWLDGLEERNDDLRRETHADIAELRQEMRARLSKVSEEMHVGFAKVSEEMHVGFARLSADVVTKLADNLRWMFGIWIASFVAIVGLLTFFRGAR